MYIIIHYIALCVQFQASVVVQLRPQETPKRHTFSSYSSPTPSSSYSGYIGGPRVDVVIPRVPLRVVCVIDVSHSMAEPYGSAKKVADDGDETTGVSKLDQVKLFMQLLIKSMGQEEFLSVVTFGTKAKVVVPLRKMTADAKVRSSCIRKILDDISDFVYRGAG